MINVDICRKCSCTKEERNPVFGALFESVKSPGWTLCFVCKVAEGSQCTIGEGDPIPPNCPHKFEHVVAAGMSVNIDKKGGDV
jgi:hypothetical protein